MTETFVQVELTQDHVNNFANLLAKAYDFPWEYAPKIDMTDSCEWGDGESPFINWEEGPDQFAYQWRDVATEAAAYLDGLGYFAEAVNSWSLQIHPKSPPVPLVYCSHHGHPADLHFKRGTCVHPFSEDGTEY